MEKILDRVSTVLLEHYGIEAEEKTGMAGYESSNLKIKSPQGNWVVKLIQKEDLPSFFIQNKVLLYAKSEKLSFSVPLVNNQDEYFTSLNDSTYIWVLGFVSGTFYAEAPPSRKLRESMGKFIGKSLNALSTMDSSLVKGHVHRWDLGNAHFSQEYLDAIEQPFYRKYALYYFEEFKNRVLPVQHQLPRQAIHGDLNDWNVLCDGDEVTAAIDIGDTCYSARINELAVALVYVMFNQKDVLKAAKETVVAAHAECEFERTEIELLFLLVGSRMAVSMANAGHSQQMNPENEYISVSQKGIEELVVKWTSFGEIHVSNQLLEACGFEVKQVAVEELVHAREKVIPKAMRLQFSEPIAMKRALFQYMYDVDGNAYLDAYNNIPHVGHGHPYVVAKAKEQLSKLNTNTRYPHELLNSYAERVLNYLPVELDRFFPVNSGSAASDLCVRLATNASENKAIYCLQHGYHGNTSTGISISNYKHDGKGGSGTPSGIEVLMLPEDPSDGDHVDAAIAKAKEQMKDAPPALFIGESIVGCGGQLPVHPRYLQAIYQLVREHGGYVAADEVQTGFTRTGTHFWSFEAAEVRPDMVVLGKPMGNGHPMAAVACTKELSEKFNNGMEFFSSFGGNPVSCAIGHAVLDVLENEGLQAHATEMGKLFLKLLKELAENDPRIKNVRGSGLFLGVEFVDEHGKPNTSLSRWVKEELKSKFVLVGTDGPHDNVLKIKPPMCFTKENVEEFCGLLGGILKNNT